MRTTFQLYKQYCLEAEKNLNLCQNYEAKFRIIEHPFAKQHDAQFLEVRYFNHEDIIKINLCFSIAYQIPIFYFMVYNSEGKPFIAEQIYQKYFSKSNLNEQLAPNNYQKGIFLSQNPITKQYFYTLHHCEMQMQLNYLIPFYFSLLGLNPPLIIKKQ